MADAGYASCQMNGRRITMGLIDKLFSKKNQRDEGMNPLEVYCRLLEIEANSLGLKEPIKKKAIDQVRQYQSMARPGASPILEMPDMKYPQYKIGDGRIMRCGVFLEDVRLCQVLPSLRRYSIRYSMMNLGNPDELKELHLMMSQQVYLLIQNLSKIPIVFFCMILPYLESKSPNIEGLKSPEILSEVYKGIENMLFEIYEELDEGKCLTGEIILQKVVNILDVKELKIPQQWLDEINQFLA